MIPPDLSAVAAIATKLELASEKIMILSLVMCQGEPGSLNGARLDAPAFTRLGERC